MEKFMQSLQGNNWYRSYLAGNAYRLQGRPEEAIEQYEHALEFDDVEEPRVLCTMASVMNDLKQHEKALQVYKHAEQLDADYVETYKGMGYTLLALAMYQQALEQYNKVTEFEGEVEECTWIEMGNCLYHLHRPEEALEKYKRALHVNPTNCAAMHGEGLCFDAIGYHEVAIRLFGGAIEANPSYAEAYLSKGVALASLGRHSEAVQAYLKTIDLDPNAHEAYNNLGASYEALEQISEATKCFTRAIELKPDYSEAHNNMGVLYRKQGSYEAALHCINRAVLLQPGQPLYLCNRAIILSKMDCSNEANEDFGKAARLFKSNNPHGLSSTNINFIRETVETYAEFIEELEENRKVEPEGEEVNKLRTSVNICVTKNLEKLLQPQSPTEDQLSQMKNEIRELKLLVAQLAKDNIKMKAELQDHEERINNIEKYLQEIVEPMKDKLYPMIEVERQLAELKKNQESTYQYVILVHRLMNSYLQSIRLISSGLFKIKNPYQSGFAESLINHVFKIAGGIPVVGKFVEKLGDLITGVLQYRARTQFQHACTKAQHFMKDLKSEGQICHALLSAIMQVCRRPLKKKEINMRICGQRAQEGWMAAQFTKLRSKILDRIRQLDRAIQAKVFGLEALPETEMPTLMLLVTGDFVAFTQGIFASDISCQSSLSELINSLLLPKDLVEPSQIAQADRIISYIYSILQNKYLSFREGQLKLVADPKNATTWQFLTVQAEHPDVYVIKKIDGEDCLMLHNSCSMTLAKVADLKDQKAHWRIMRDKRTEGSQFYVQSQFDFKLFFNSKTRTSQSGWWFCSQKQAIRSEFGLSEWTKSEEILWRLERTRNV